jgi:hypothetical protein
MPRRLQVLRAIAGEFDLAFARDAFAAAGPCRRAICRRFVQRGKLHMRGVAGGARSTGGQRYAFHCPVGYSVRTPVEADAAARRLPVPLTWQSGRLVTTKHA